MLTGQCSNAKGMIAMPDRGVDLMTGTNADTSVQKAAQDDMQHLKHSIDMGTEAQNLWVHKSCRSLPT